jgi:predicted acylesterase/phospholipase RssA
VPAERTSDAVVLGDAAVRTWEREPSPAFIEEVLRAIRTEVDLLRVAGHQGRLPPAHMLAISGGGSYGAYGAGLLCGWTEHGDRPTFTVVTGISTGALTAPFAFLGPAYDDKLQKVYTTVSTSDVIAWRGIAAALFNDSAFDTTPLRRLIERLMDDQALRDIAAEYEKGRLLLVGTCDLDSFRSVIWNMGLIARHHVQGHPRAMRLFHDVLMASASIPAAFPPVMIDVELDGKTHQEMHVDGGTKNQVFLYPASFSPIAQASRWRVERDRVAFIIRNGRQQLAWEEVSRRTPRVARRSVSALIHAQGIGDLFRIYLVTQRDQVDFNLAIMPDSFTYTTDDHFDPVFMSKLFEVGFQAANQAGGYPWYKVPPGWVSEFEALSPTP